MFELSPETRIAELEAQNPVLLTAPSGSRDAVGEPIACIENQHDIAKHGLARLGELTDNVAVPEATDATYRQVLARLARFDLDMAVHIYKEDKVLFPRALDAQAARRSLTQAPNRTVPDVLPP